MMNDRFAAQLRQHLLDTANERPADGQMSAIDARVAVTGQRRPLAARLTWERGRVGGLPTPLLRYVLVGIALVLAMVGGAIVGSGNFPAPSPGPTTQETPAPTTRPTEEPMLVEPTGDSGCVDLAFGGTYTGAAGAVLLTATLPEAPATRWQGTSGNFHMTESCDGLAISIFATTLEQVPANSCRASPGTEVPSFDDAVAHLDAQEGDGISNPVDLTIDGRAAARFDVTQLSACPGGFGLQGGVILGEGETGSIFVIDADGAVVSIEVNWTVGATAAQVAEARSIVASLKIGRLSGPTSAPAAP